MKKLPKVYNYRSTKHSFIMPVQLATTNTMQNVTKSCYFCTYMHKKKIIQKSNAGLTGFNCQ